MKVNSDRTTAIPAGEPVIESRPIEAAAIELAALDAEGAPAASRGRNFERTIDAATAKARVESLLPQEEVLVADNGQSKAAPYPVSVQALDHGIAMTERRAKELPVWVMNDKRFFFQRHEAGNPLLLQEPLKLIIPSDAEIKNQPLTRKFDASDRSARQLYGEAADFYKMAKDFLAEGDVRSAQMYFDQGRLLENRAGRFGYRNEQWLNLRREHRTEALDKHAENMRDMTMAGVSALGADAYVFGKAFGGLTKLYGNIKNLAKMKAAGDVAAKTGQLYVKGEGLARLEQVLANPEELAKMKPEELMEISGSLKYAGTRGAALTQEEAAALIKTAANRPEFVIAQGEALIDHALKEVGQDVAAVLVNDARLAKMSPQQLVARTGGALTEGEAKTVITAADLRLNREIDGMGWQEAIAALEQRTDGASKTMAEQMSNFMRGHEAHQRLVALTGQKMNPVVTEIRNLTPQQLAARYNLPAAEAEALAKDLKAMPDKFSFAQHDMWGPAGKNKTGIARSLGRPGSPANDPVVAYGHYRHNLQFGHHSPADPATRLESALDKMDAMRDTARAYRNFEPMTWEAIDEAIAKTKDPAERAWLKLARQEVKRMEDAGEIPRNLTPKGSTPTFKVGV